MALKLACETPGELAAVASFGGAGAGRAEACQPPEGERTHVLEIHAVGDLFVRYDGALNIQGNQCVHLGTCLSSHSPITQRGPSGVRPLEREPWCFVMRIA
jgi:poly(3-hydroxybutyrate) depolymerase